MKKERIYLIGIAGGSGSGKTTFTEKVINQLHDPNVAHIHQDWYYLPKQPKEHFVNGKPNFDHPDAFDWKLIHEQLSLLLQGHIIDCPQYDYVTSNRKKQTLKLGPCKVALFEGIHALWNEEVRSLFHMKVFIHVDADIRFIRRLHRDVKDRGRTLDGVINQYYDTVRPMHRQFLEPIGQFADITAGEETDIAAQLLASRIREILRDI